MFFDLFRVFFLFDIYKFVFYVCNLMLRRFFKWIYVGWKFLNWFFYIVFIEGFFGL